MHACVREGNGTPLWCSCLENPVDGGAWKAAVHEAAEPRSRASSGDQVGLLLLLLLLSCFSHVRLCVTPQMAAHKAPPSLGLSRQERWSGLPFPSPVHAHMHAKSLQSCRILCDPMGRLLCPWDSLGKNTGVGCHFLLQGVFPPQEWNP